MCIGGVPPEVEDRGWNLENTSDWGRPHIAYGYRKSIGDMGLEAGHQELWACGQELVGKAGSWGDHGPDHRVISPSSSI